MSSSRWSFAPVLSLLFLSAAASSCNSRSSGSSGVSCSAIGPDAELSQDAGACYPDNDGINGGSYMIDLIVDEKGFLASGPDAGVKDIIATQNDAQVTLTLTNNGTKPHGFEVECTNVCSMYPTLPA